MTASVFFSLRASDGNVEPLRELLLQRRDEVVPGREAYDVYQGIDDPHRFVLAERWASPEDHQADFQQNVVASGLIEKLMTLVEEAPAPPVYYVQR